MPTQDNAPKRVDGVTSLNGEIYDGIEAYESRQRPGLARAHRVRLQQLERRTGQ